MLAADIALGTILGVALYAFAGFALYVFFGDFGDELPRGWRWARKAVKLTARGLRRAFYPPEKPVPVTPVDVSTWAETQQICGCGEAK